MSIITKDTKHNKYATEWKENIQRLARVLEKDDQTKLSPLLTEVEQLNQAQTKIKQQIKKLENQAHDLGDIIGQQQRVQDQLTDLKANYTGSQTKVKSSFLGQAPNKYDWETKIKNYFPTTYADNLYQGTVHGSPLQITEPTALKLLTRVIKAFEKINQTKFATKFSASSHTTGTNHLPAIQKLAQDGLKSNEIIGKDANGSDLPTQGQPANHATLNQFEYSFKSQYVQDADSQKSPSATPFTPQSTEIITPTKVLNFFTFITGISKDGSIHPDFLTELKSDADILKEVENNTTYKLVPTQKKALEPTKLADYGIKVTNDSNTKLYLSDQHDKAVKFTINEGLKSWVELVHAFFPSGSTQRTKLADSFTADPYTQLLTDISSNTHSTHWELPESKEDLQTIANQIELKKLSAAGRLTHLGEKIQEQKEELNTKSEEFTNKEQELNALLQKIITKKREKLNKSNLKEFEGDNRKTQLELTTLQRLLFEIRYLEKEGNSSLASSMADENNALTTIENLLKKVSDLPFSSGWDTLAWSKDKDQITIEEKIKFIQEQKSVLSEQNSLTYWYDLLVEREKIIKLEEWQQEIKTKLKAAIDQKSPEENLQEWRDTLKTVEADLATSFTEEKITQWKQKKDGQAQFDNTASIKSLLEKVKGDNKFIEFIKKKDAVLDTLSKLIEHKDPVEVIKLIIRYTEYDKLAEEAQKTKKQQLVWTLEKKDENGKYLDDTDLTEDEITQTLYEIELGKKSLASKKKADETEDNNDSPFQSTPAKGHFGQYWWAYLLGGIVIIGALVAIFWKQLKAWWTGPIEAEGKVETEAEKEEEIE